MLDILKELHDNCTWCTACQGCKDLRLEAASEIRKLRQYVKDSGETFYSCPVCGHGRTIEECLRCEKNDFRWRLLKKDAEIENLNDQIKSSEKAIDEICMAAHSAIVATGTLLNNIADSGLCSPEEDEESEPHGFPTDSNGNVYYPDYFYADKAIRELSKVLGYR